MRNRGRGRRGGRLLEATSGGGNDFILSLNPFAFFLTGRGYFTTSAGSTPAGATDPIGRWEDQTGNGRHIIQATANNRPTATTVGADLAVVTDGSNDSLGITGISLPEPYTVTGVFSTVAAGQTGDIVGGATIESRVRNEGNQIHSYGTGAVYTGAGMTMPTDGTKIVVTGRWNGVNTKFRKNTQADVAAEAPAGVTTLTEFRIGNRGDGGVPWSGRHFFYALFNRLLTDWEVTQLHAYLGFP